MELEDIRSLIGVAERLGIAELEARKGDVTLRLARAGLPDTPEPTQAFVRAEPDQGAAPESGRADLVAPLSGVLHLSPAPDAQPFVTPGQQVKRGETLCIIEAMKVFSRVGAERDGVVEAVLFETGAEIEAGQTLMRIA